MQIPSIGPYAPVAPVTPVRRVTRKSKTSEASSEDVRAANHPAQSAMAKASPSIQAALDEMKLGG